MKTIFISSFHPLISRNILSAGIPAMLAREGFRVVILCPDYKVPYFKEMYEGEKIAVAGVDTALTFYDRVFRSLVLLFTDSEGMRIKERSRCSHDFGFVRCTVVPLLRKIFGNRYVVLTMLRFLDQAAYRGNRFDRVFKEYAPVLAFAADLQNEMDVRLLHEARKKGIKTVGMIRSWDNITSKGNLRTVPGKILVHNERIKDELVSFSHIKGERITPIGIPHYDRYLEEPGRDQEAFLEGYGFDPKRKTILFSPIGDRYIRDNRLDNLVYQELLRLPVNLLVRMPPTDSATLMTPDTHEAVVAFDTPGGDSAALRVEKRSKKQNEISPEDDSRLHEELRYADLLVTGQSTLVNDASLLDLPSVIIAFDGEPRDYYDSMRRYYDYEYYRPIVESGGVAMVYERTQLRDVIENELADPGLRSEGRERIVKEQAFKGDGKASQRLVRELVQAI